MKKLLPVFLLCAMTPTLVFAQDGKVKSNDEKLADDPTKVITQIGVSYTNDFDMENEVWTINGSLALDEARKINARISSDGDEWRIGGSWLFDIGIFNFNFARNEFDDGSTQNTYNVGTFMPLSYFGFEPLGFQVFPMAGYSYSDGEKSCNPNVPSGECVGEIPIPSDGYILVPSSSHSGYVGAFSLRPLTDSLSMMMFLGGNLGTDDYSGYWGGAGVTYQINKHQSFNVYTYLSDNSFGRKEVWGASYKYQF